MTNSMKRRHYRSIVLSLILGFVSMQAEAIEILGCATEEKTAVSPSDKLQCEGREGNLAATLLELYSEGWRLIDTEFFERDRQVLYLEREEPPGTNSSSASESRAISP